MDAFLWLIDDYFLLLADTYIFLYSISTDLINLVEQIDSQSNLSTA